MDLTQGNITGKLIKFALPLMLGNILQQCYNIADTLIVGRFVGKILLNKMLHLDILKNSVVILKKQIGNQLQLQH